MKRNIMDMIKAADSIGWRLSKMTRRGHLVFENLGKARVIASGTPSDKRSWKNCLATMKRIGKYGLPQVGKNAKPKPRCRREA